MSTCAALAAASEAWEARAVVAADCVGTRGVRAAVVCARAALIHVWQAYGGVGRGGAGEDSETVGIR
jgi:hypothetical protein